jgi:hypothetical protein
MKSVFDRSFNYTPAVQTDIKKTFARVRREMRDKQRAQEQAEVEANHKVSPIKAVKTASFNQR